MSFTYVQDIPFPTNSPSNDQPIMRTNTNSIYNIWEVDHFTFDESPQGTHKQITFSTENVPGAQTDPASTLYTDSGTASTNAQMFYRNADTIIPVSLIKAYGVFASNGATSGSQAYNLSAVQNVGPITYTLTVPANVLTGTDYAVLLTPRNAAYICQYNITSATEFSVIFRETTSGTGFATAFTCIVLQL